MPVVVSAPREAGDPAAPLTGRPTREARKRTLHVLKFGGSSVDGEAAVHRAARIVQAAWGAGVRPVVITSAVRGATDELLAAISVASAGEHAVAVAGVSRLVHRHRSLAADLLPGDAQAQFDDELDRAARDIGDLLRVAGEHPGTRAPLQDEVVSYGERLASRLLAIALARRGMPAIWVDSRACIRTDDTYTCAAPLRLETEEGTRQILLPLLERDAIPILGGFVGSSRDGGTTTLGRGGSDLSASLIGAALEADEIQIWTDVDGFLTADPAVVPGARTIPRLTYAEAAELASFGARVLHPRTIEPAVTAGIPIRIRNSSDQSGAGTRIDEGSDETACRVKGVVCRPGMTILRIEAARMLGAYGFLRALFEVFDRHRTVVDIVATSEVSVSLSLQRNERLDDIIAELKMLGNVSVEHGQSIVCVVGEGLRRSAGIAARVFGAVSDINVSVISQGASSTNLTFAVGDDVAQDAVTRLHATFFDT